MAETTVEPMAWNLVVLTAVQMVEQVVDVMVASWALQMVD
jgi:hypothetical protein